MKVEFLVILSSSDFFLCCFKTEDAPKPAQSQDLRAETDELLKDLGIPPSGIFKYKIS